MQVVRRVLAICLLIGVALATPLARADTLSTGVPTNGGGEGAFFNVTTNSQVITITGFESTLVGNVNARIYYRPGGYQGFENTAAGWTLLGSQNIAGGSGFIQTLYPVSVGNVVVPANQTYGFLIYVGFTGTGTQAVRIDTSSAVTVNDANVTVYAGDSSYGGNFFTPFDGSIAARAWRGSVIYSLGDLTKVAPVAPIPNLTGLPGIAGIGNRPTVLDLGAGQGPTMVECLMGTVRRLLGADAVYLGQDANGVAKIKQGGRVIAFYPLDASTSTNVSADIHLGSSNVLNIGTSCGNFNVVPAIANLGEFGALVNGLGQTVNTNSQGVLTLTVGSTVYVVRPDYFVSTGAAAGPSLVQGADGLYRFTDSAGNQQVLRPAFLDTDALSAQLATLMGGWTIMQLDGTALFTKFDGQQFLATPDLTLTAASAANAGKLWWQEGASNHYLFRSNSLILAQGLTLQAR